MDVDYEEQLWVDATSLRIWLAYLDTVTREDRFRLYDRAVTHLPRSYKLWKRYIDDLMVVQTALTELDPAASIRVHHVCERALAQLPQMPRLLLVYVEFLMHQPCITWTRRVFDRALRALPLLQHARIWKRYVEFATRVGGETAFRVLSRFVQWDPTGIEDLIDVLIAQHRIPQAIQHLLQLSHDVDFKSKHGLSHAQLFQRVVDLLVEYPDTLPDSFPAEQILLDGIHLYHDLAGKLWCALAQFYARLGQFTKARETYERALHETMRVRDLVQVFDAYAEFEETLISARMDAMASATMDPATSPLLLLPNTTPLDELEHEFDQDLDASLDHLESLLQRRPWLISDVKLRQNPNDIQEWLLRVELATTSQDIQLIKHTYEDAFTRVHPRKAIDASFATLWCNYARFLEEHQATADDIAQVYERAVLVDFKQIHELVQCWCAYIEFYIRQE